MYRSLVLEVSWNFSLGEQTECEQNPQGVAGQSLTSKPDKPTTEQSTA